MREEASSSCSSIKTHKHASNISMWMFIHPPIQHINGVYRVDPLQMFAFSLIQNHPSSAPNVCTQHTFTHSTYASNNASDSSILSILMLNMHYAVQIHMECVCTLHTQLLAACICLLLTEKQCRIGPVTQRKTYWEFVNKQEQQRQQITNSNKNYRHTFTRSANDGLIRQIFSRWN